MGTEAGCLEPYRLFSCFFLQENNLSKGSYTPLWGGSTIKSVGMIVQRIREREGGQQ
jgi:hypothetical protein